jgi:hypothetical protein
LAFIEGIANYRKGANESATLLTFILGALVFGAFAPRKTMGFAAPAAKRIVG